MYDIPEFFSRLFSDDSWPARWFCGRWTPFHGWLYIISSLMIAAAYFTIPLILFILIKKAKDKLPFQRIFWLFFLFILACGLTHVADAVVFWYPVYRISATLLFITALISWAALVGLYKVLPNALLLKSPEALEKIISSRTDELAQTNIYLKKSNEELKEAQKISQAFIRQRDDFISIASHELKTPVTSLKMYAYMLENEESLNKVQTKSMVANMAVQINKLSVLINEMLDSSKLKEGRLNYNMEEVKINEVINDLITQKQITTPFHKIIFEENAEVIIWADKERISQVLENLLSNAIKYSRNADKIIIKTDEAGDFLNCSVQDFGMGIPAIQQSKIFDRFYRVSGENIDTYPGMGLGLFIVKDIIERHNGEIWVESEPGIGSTFHFKIPCKAEVELAYL